MRGVPPSRQQRTERATDIQSILNESINTREMDPTAGNHSNMHDLMTGPPAIVMADAATLGKADNVNDSTEKVNEDRSGGATQQNQKLVIGPRVQQARMKKRE